MRVEKNENGKWCIYDGDGNKVGEEYETEEAAREAMARMRESYPHEYTYLAGEALQNAEAINPARPLDGTLIQLALPGRYIKNGQEFDITEKDFAAAVKNFEASANPLPVDYEHNTFVKGAEAPAAGWIKRVINKGAQGLFAVVSWTERAAQQIRAGEYKFISPVFFFNATDTKTGAKIGTMLGPAGLTNFPLIQGMEPLTAKRTEPKTKETGMNELLKKIFLALKIDAVSEEISEDKAIEMITAKAASAEPPKRPKTVVPVAILSALELPEDASESDARGAIMALKFPSDRIPVDRYRKLEDQMHERDINELIERACRPGEGEMEGKLYPHEREWAIAEAKKDFETMRAFIKHRPKVLTLMAKLPVGGKDPAHIDPAQESINKQMGVSKETFLKYNTAH